MRAAASRSHQAASSRARCARSGGSTLPRPPSLAAMYWICSDVAAQGSVRFAFTCAQLCICTVLRTMQARQTCLPSWSPGVHYSPGAAQRTHRQCNTMLRPCVSVSTAHPKLFWSTSGCTGHTHVAKHGVVDGLHRVQLRLRRSAVAGRLRALRFREPSGGGGGGGGRSGPGRLRCSGLTRLLCCRSLQEERRRLRHPVACLRFPELDRRYVDLGWQEGTYSAA